MWPFNPYFVCKHYLWGFWGLRTIYLGGLSLATAQVSKQMRFDHKMSSKGSPSTKEFLTRLIITYHLCNLSHITFLYFIHQLFLMKWSSRESSDRKTALSHAKSSVYFPCFHLLLSHMVTHNCHNCNCCSLSHIICCNIFFILLTSLSWLNCLPYSSLCSHCSLRSFLAQQLNHNKAPVTTSHLWLPLGESPIRYSL